MKSIEIASGWGQAADLVAQLDLAEKMLRNDATLAGPVGFISLTVCLFSETFNNKHAELRESAKQYLCT